MGELHHPGRRRSCSNGQGEAEEEPTRRKYPLYKSISDVPFRGKGEAHRLELRPEPLHRPLQLNYQ